MKFITFGLFVFYISFIHAQNLIPNGGFEHYTQCPNGLRQLEFAQQWNAANAGSPELFHDCGFSDRVVRPYSGEGMAGLILLADYSNGVEYLQIRLKDSLEKGKEYCFSYQIRLHPRSAIGINKIGAHFSRKKISSPNWEAFYLKPKVYNQEVIKNKQEWVEISDEFQAKGGETYMTFGNFFQKHYLKEEFTRGQKTISYSYYYLDEFQLFSKGKSCDVNFRELEYPMETPAIQSISIYFDVDSFNLDSTELNRLIEFVAQLPERIIKPIEINGFTDNDASNNYNLILSEKRTSTVREILLNYGFQNTIVNWYGEEKPINKNSSNEEKLKNRRVDIIAYP